MNARGRDGSVVDDRADKGTVSRASCGADGRADHSTGSLAGNCADCGASEGPDHPADGGTDGGTVDGTEWSANSETASGPGSCADRGTAGGLVGGTGGRSGAALRSDHGHTGDSGPDGGANLGADGTIDPGAQNRSDGGGGRGTGGQARHDPGELAGCEANCGSENGTISSPGRCPGNLAVGCTAGGTKSPAGRGTGSECGARNSGVAPYADGSTDSPAQNAPAADLDYSGCALSTGLAHPNLADGGADGSQVVPATPGNDGLRDHGTACGAGAAADCGLNTLADRGAWALVGGSDSGGCSDSSPDSSADNPSEGHPNSLVGGRAARSTGSSSRGGGARRLADGDSDGSADRGTDRLAEGCPDRFVAFSSGGADGYAGHRLGSQAGCSVDSFTGGPSEVFPFAQLGDQTLPPDAGRNSDSSADIGTDSGPGTRANCDASIPGGCRYVYPADCRADGCGSAAGDTGCHRTLGRGDRFNSLIDSVDENDEEDGRDARATRRTMAATARRSLSARAGTSPRMDAHGGAAHARRGVRRKPPPAISGQACGGCGAAGWMPGELEDRRRPRGLACETTGGACEQLGRWGSGARGQLGRWGGGGRAFKGQAPAPVRSYYETASSFVMFVNTTFIAWGTHRSVDPFSDDLEGQLEGVEGYDKGHDECDDEDHDAESYYEIANSFVMFVNAMSIAWGTHHSVEILGCKGGDEPREVTRMALSPTPHQERGGDCRRPAGAERAEDAEPPAAGQPTALAAAGRRPCGRLRVRGSRRCRGACGAPPAGRALQVE